MDQPTPQDMARIALELLNRVDLKGSEVPAFNAVQQWLIGMTVPTEPQTLEEILGKSTEPMPHEDEDEGPADEDAA